MILYSIGDSVTWGAELENKEEERYSKLVANHLDGVDCNNASLVYLMIIFLEIL